jgi:hypothetical protein
MIQSVKLTTQLRTEAREQCIVAHYLDILKSQGKILQYSATPSSTYTTSWNQKIKNKNMGVKKGVPDLTIVHSRGVLYIEMKKIKGGLVSKEQKEWIRDLNSVEESPGSQILALVCKGAEEAKTVINEVIGQEYNFVNYLLGQQEKWNV